MATYTSFLPNDRGTLTVSVTSASANNALLRAPTSGVFQVRVYNAGSALVFIRFGEVTVNSAGTVDLATTVAATTADIPIAAGNTETFTVDSGTTRIAALTASGTATLYVTTGEGM
jgi:hypothetical protein